MLEQVEARNLKLECKSAAHNKKWGTVTQILSNCTVT